MGRWNERGAKAELIKIIDDAIAGAVVAAPILVEDFRSDIFIHNVVAPTVVHFLRDLTVQKPELELVQGYINRFVKPFLNDRSLEVTLSRLFRTRQSELEHAFSAFLTCLRPALYASKHWREPIRDQAIEETRSAILRIEQSLRPVKITDAVNVDEARVDARASSEPLRSWPQTIGGKHIVRPELEVLLQRIREQPYACTLVIGESGSGKSALFAELVESLQSQGMVVFAIKADLLPTHVKTLSDVSTAMGLRGHLLGEIDALSRVAPVVVLIDQLDAVSEVMDRSSERMKLLLQIAHHFQGKKRIEQAEPPVHVLVSSRPFEADYDARFLSLGAEVIQLALPSQEQVHSLLQNLGIAIEDIPEALYETIRRPFALRILVDILRRGVPGKELMASQLLYTWLASANFGDAAERKSALQFLERLAADMTESESLWRPGDSYEIQDPLAVQSTVASGIIVRQGALLGFSHQAWLDDFQAKNFTTAQSLANYAWQRQDGLFARATVLRALQRLRAVDVPAYENAVDALLGDSKTRRHLRHLVADLVAGQPQPSAREYRWLQHLVRSDAPLARRMLSRVTTHWQVWRVYIRPLMAEIMGNVDLHWSAVHLLIAEAAFDADFVTQSIGEYWAQRELDIKALQVFSKSGLWSSSVVERLKLVLANEKVDDYLIVDYSEKLSADQAVELLKIYLHCVPIDKESRLRFHDLDKLTKRALPAFANVLFAWFVDVATRDEGRHRGRRDAYPCSASLPLWWDQEHWRDGIFEGIKSVVLGCAKEYPGDFLLLASAFSDVEVDEVQALIAEGFAAGSTTLTNDGFEYLLADSRRLQVGMATRQDTNNRMHLVDGWSTQVLLRAIIPKLGLEKLKRLHAYIESWDPYSHRNREECDVQIRRERRIWAQERRFPLLALLPEQIVKPRLHRQIQEWHVLQPDLRDGLISTKVRSPMSDVQMGNASDENIFKLIDEVGDHSDRWLGRQGTRRDGGTEQLARSFAEFGKIHPERAMGIAESRFRSGRHENAAGELLRAVATDSSVDAQRVQALVWKWHREGFASESWRRDVAWALQELANRSEGLNDDVIELLESWIVYDLKCISERIAARIRTEQRRQEVNSKHEAEPSPIVFRLAPGGMRILPQGNFTLLAAIAAGLLGRTEPDWDGWLSFLERHADRPEDPVVWTTLLIFRGQTLYWANRERAIWLVQTIWDRFPDAFLDKYVADFLWHNRELVSGDLMKAIRDSWLSGDDAGNRQAAGELLTAAVLLDPKDEIASTQLESILAGPESPERLGALFAASTAWREDLPAIRQDAHQILMRFVQQVDGNDAFAIASVFSYKGPPAADTLTKEVLSAIAMNPSVLGACLDRNFVEDLQELLHNPGFEDLILEVAERSTELMFAKEEPRVRMSYGESFVTIAIALQRSMNPLRSRAMDLYERLLDEAAYGAEKASAASLSRTWHLESEY